MNQRGASPPPPSVVPEQDLSRTYLLVILVEVAVIAALYWLGRAFA
jgi:hypothetical protein